MPLGDVRRGQRLDRGCHARGHVLEDQVRRVRHRVGHDVEVVAHAQDQEDDLERRGERDVHHELVRADAVKERSLAAGLDGEGAQFADIVEQEAGVDRGRHGVVRQRSRERSRGAEPNGADGDGANDVTEAFYVILILFVW